MEGQERREQIIEILKQEKGAISGSALAKRLGVSRQVIVQDIALLRAANWNIMSMTKGYVLFVQKGGRYSRKIRVNHTYEQMEEELNTVIDYGGSVKDVIVPHPVYGEISVELILNNRREIQEFLEKIKTQQGVPLMEISKGLHSHTIEADSEIILDQIETRLQTLGFLEK